MNIVKQYTINQQTLENIRAIVTTMETKFSTINDMEGLRVNCDWIKDILDRLPEDNPYLAEVRWCHQLILSRIIFLTKKKNRELREANRESSIARWRKTPQ